MLPTSTPTIDADGLRLRECSCGDVGLVRLFARDPAITRITTVPADGGDDAIAAYIERQRGRATTGQGYQFVIEVTDGPGAVGQIGLTWRSDDHTRASVGYWLAAEFRGRGYARRALSALVEWVRGLGIIERLELYAEPANRASRRTAEAAGFRCEGLLGKWEPVSGVRRDMVMYALLFGGGDPA